MTAILDSLSPNFRQFPLQAVGPVDLPPVAGVPLRAEIDRFEGARNSFLDPSALQTVSADLGPLSSEQFAQARAAFGGRSQVAYQGGRSYQVVDFLPPLVQALVNQDLEIPSPVTLPDSAALDLLPRDQDKSVDLTMNCHAAAWEAARAFQAPQNQVHIFMGEMISMDDLVHSPRFESLGEAKGPEGLKPGDLVQFYEQSDWKRVTMLLHTACYVGGGLFFEKPNTESAEEDSPFRLATWDMVKKPLDHFTEGRWKAEAFRPKQPLESAETAFRSGAAAELEQWAQAHHTELGRPLCLELEQSLGGGIRGEAVTALATVPVGLDAQGRGQLRP